MTAGDGIDVLAGAAIGGDRSALERLLGSIQPLVVRYCRARIGMHERSYALADDVAQEVCLAVLTALPSYRDQGRPFLAFVYGIAAHKVANAHRSAARNRAEPVPEFPDTPELWEGPEAHAVAGELPGRMARLISTLPPKQREIILLRLVVGLSAEETADAVRSTPGAVRVAQHRALNRLRKAMAAEDELTTVGRNLAGPGPAASARSTTPAPRRQSGGESDPLDIDDADRQLDAVIISVEQTVHTALGQIVDPVLGLAQIRMRIAAEGQTDDDTARRSTDSEGL